MLGTGIPTQISMNFRNRRSHTAFPRKESFSRPNALPVQVSRHDAEQSGSPAMPLIRSYAVMGVSSQYRDEAGCRAAGGILGDRDDRTAGDKRRSRCDIL